METQRAILAIALSIGILLVYQYFFAPQPPPPQPEGSPPAAKVASPAAPSPPPPSLEGNQAVGSAGRSVSDRRIPAGRDIPVETGLYRATITEAGGEVGSYLLKEYRQSIAKDAPLQNLVRTTPEQGLPLFFSWGVEPARAGVPLFAADRSRVEVGPGGEERLVLTSRPGNGVEIVKSFRFKDQDYRLGLTIEVRNVGNAPLKGAPYLTLTNRPFADKVNRFVFTGPAALVDGALQEVKVDDLKKKGARSFTGQLQWMGYEDSYFICAIIPRQMPRVTAHFSLAGEDVVTSVLAGGVDSLPVGGKKSYTYTVYFGPKKLALLKSLGDGLDRAVNFGWFDILAKPTLYLLNFFYRYVGNYGVAIILVTVLIKLLFWPIAHKGMKSMKTMQKLQPKMAKLREKYKDDRERQQQEMMKLYQTYKVNPLGGCLPMVLQIPVFFALYRVLLQAIELRHAPFMLWINDLSAPDRLHLGFDIPMLGGLPVLTLLMGASMFLQQKMTPSTGDPTQAKIMMFLPVVFTFMFINFPSGLVLYWLVNNLLSIAQQYVINRQAAAEEAA